MMRGQNKNSQSIACETLTTTQAQVTAFLMPLLESVRAHGGRYRETRLAGGVALETASSEIMQSRGLTKLYNPGARYHQIRPNHDGRRLYLYHGVHGVLLDGMARAVTMVVSTEEG